MRRTKTGITVASLLLLALLGGGAAIWSRSAGQEKSAVTTAAVSRMDLEEGVLASGTLTAGKSVAVGAQVSGQVRRLTVTLGEQVRKGQLLAEIDPVLQENALKEAEAALESVQAQILAKKALLKQYDLALRRLQELTAQNITARADLESAQAQYDSTGADVAALDAQLRRSRVTVATATANLEYTRISAPMDGVVVAIVTEQGQTVVSAQSAPTILKLADLETITVKAQISEADVIRVRPGQKVYFTILGDPDTRHYGTLRAVEPAPEATATGTAVYYNGLFDVPNPGHTLRLSMTAQVTVVAGEAKQVLAVPVAALGEKSPDGRQRVRLLTRDGATEERVVRIGMTNHLFAQVVEGLKEGERVVVDAAPLVQSSSGMGHPPPGRR